MNLIIPTDTRVLEIIRGYISDRSNCFSKPDMNNEKQLVTLCNVIVDEVRALNPEGVKK